VQPTPKTFLFRLKSVTQASIPAINSPMKIPRWVSKSGPHARGALVALLVLLLILLFPFKTTIVPDWSLKVVDEEGAAVGEINVTEHWQHYLLESSSHEEVQRAGGNGLVSFPERSIRASLVRRAWATVSRTMENGWQARRMPAASIVIWGNKDYSTTVAVYNPTQLPQSHVIVPSTK
jgi:hypothetical protein